MMNDDSQRLKLTVKVKPRNDVLSCPVHHFFTRDHRHSYRQTDKKQAGKNCWGVVCKGILILLLGFTAIHFYTYYIHACIGVSAFAFGIVVLVIYNLSLSKDYTNKLGVSVVLWTPKNRANCFSSMRHSHELISLEHVILTIKLCRFAYVTWWRNNVRDLSKIERLAATATCSV